MSMRFILFTTAIAATYCSLASDWPCPGICTPLTSLSPPHDARMKALPSLFRRLEGGSGNTAWQIASGSALKPRSMRHQRCRLRRIAWPFCRTTSCHSGSLSDDSLLHRP